MRSGQSVCKKWWGGFWTQTIDNPNSHQNIIITFWPIYNVLWNLHANLFRGICIKSTNEQAKSMRKQLISFAQVIKFCKISSSRVFFNPKPPPCVRPCLPDKNFYFNCFYWCKYVRGFDDATQCFKSGGPGSYGLTP